MHYVYLASPYSHPDYGVRERRYREACYAAASLMRDGHVVYSPIAHSHPISEIMPPRGHEFWMRQCMPMLAHASALFILTIHGHEQSVGVRKERDVAEALGIPINYVQSSLGVGR